MSNPRTLGPWLRRFLAEYIVTERNLARNTQKSYRDTFALLLPFAGTKIRKPVERLTVQDLTAGRIRQFLDHLEDERGCSAQTRNQRLSAIRAFARFVASRDPGHLEWSASIRAIASKKATPRPIGWLTKTEMNKLLDVPNRRTPRGRVEYAFLLFLYNTGARVSEATRLVAGDLQVGRRDGGHALVNIHGKGGNTGSVRCGRGPKKRSPSWCEDGLPAMPSSSANSEDPIRGPEPIGSSSAVPPACRRSPEGGSHLTRSVTPAPATCSRPESIGTRSVPGSVMPASIPPMSTPRSIWR